VVDDSDLSIQGAAGLEQYRPVILPVKVPGRREHDPEPECIQAAVRLAATSVR
jgi:hypothetical protein